MVLLLPLSELHLLAVDLSFLLGLVDKFVLVLKLGSLSSDLNHLIDVCYFHREGLLVG